MLRYDGCVSPGFASLCLDRTGANLSHNTPSNMLNSCTSYSEHGFVGRREKGQPLVNSVARSNKGEEEAKDLRGLHNAFTLTIIFAQ